MAHHKRRQLVTPPGVVPGVFYAERVRRHQRWLHFLWERVFNRPGSPVSLAQRYPTPQQQRQHADHEGELSE